MKTFGTIAFYKPGKQWQLALEPHVSMRFKDLFRKVSKSSVGWLTIKDSDDVRRDIAWFMDRYPLSISPEDHALISDGVSSYNKREADIEALFVPGVKLADYQLAKQPRDYQKVAIEVLLRNKALLCADDVGLGKTIVGIGGIVAAGEFPAMVVCQTHLPAQWVEKFKEFAPQVRCHVVKTRREYSLPEADVYIMPYSRIIGWGDIIAKGTFRTVVYDEVQELRRQESEKYIVSKKLSEKAGRVLGLSATPIYNYGGEMFSVMDVIAGGCLGSWEEFQREWCTSYFGDKPKVKDPKALGTFLREKAVMVRRTRKDVARELPAINKVVHQVEYDENVAEAAEKELEEIAARVVSGSFVERGQASRELDARARMMTGIAKANGVADYVRILLENGEKVLLVGWHREVYDMWGQKLTSHHPVMYTGSESPTQKEEARKRFMRKPSYVGHSSNEKGEPASNLLMMSLRSGVGLDGLQEVCSLVVFGELDWSPGVHEQVVGRLQRDGQPENVTALYLTSDNGTDNLMLDILGLKSSQASGIVNPTADVEFVQSDDSRIKRLAESILGRKK